MTDLRALLVTTNVRRALIVDDAYDQVPLPADLSAEADEWTQFFEDVKDEDLAVLRQIYPPFDEVRADELPVLPDFVAALWQHRSQLRAEIIDPLFARYVSGQAKDLEYLEELVNRLSDFGLTCTTAGRLFHDKANAADLIVIDLFLGSTQGESDSMASIKGLTKVMAGRPDRPPLIILMSRSPRLDGKREEFRDSVGLFESAFRILRKAELADPGKLQRLLTRLARHYTDSLKLAAFLRAWDQGLSQAGKRTSTLIRTLDLADHAQIRHLLLSAEGEPTGSYLVDVFDRVLQHEIEGETSIINAARELNALTGESYPPPYVAGSRDLQNLVHRSLFQHRERLRLLGAEDSRVAFGDLLRRKAIPAGTNPPVAQNANEPLSGINEQEVLVVLTPACDLQRQGAERVLFLVGILKLLQPADWSYKDDPIRTPVLELAEGQRWWIKWDLKHIETLSHVELDRVLTAANGFEIVARLRESHALELQQKLLASLGRVGQIAQMPATFHMQVGVFLPDAERRLVRLDVPTLEQEGGVCYVGREGQRVVLCEDVCEAICAAIASYDQALVHTRAREAVAFLLTSGDLLQALEQGVSLPNPQAQTFKDIQSPSGSLTADGSMVRPIGLVARNRNMQDARLSGGEVSKAGIVLATWDHLG